MVVLIWIGVAVFLFAVLAILGAEFIAGGVPVLPSEHSDTREVEIAR